jgi:hypothetical protein
MTRWNVKITVRPIMNTIAQSAMEEGSKMTNQN